MKLDTETKTARSLKREYDMWIKLANREDAPKIEQNYYKNIVERVGAQIDWSKLENKKKEKKDNEYNKYYDY